MAIGQVRNLFEEEVDGDIEAIGPAGALLETKKKVVVGVVVLVVAYGRTGGSKHTSYSLQHGQSKKPAANGHEKPTVYISLRSSGQEPPQRIILARIPIDLESTPIVSFKPPSSRAV